MSLGNNPDRNSPSEEGGNPSEAQPQFPPFAFSETSLEEGAHQHRNFMIAAALKAEIQRDFPDWNPGERARWQIGRLRDIGAFLQPDTLYTSDPAISDIRSGTEQYVEHFRVSFQNISQYLAGKPLALGTEEGRDARIKFELINSDDPNYDQEGTSALWIVRGAFHCAGDNEILLQKLFTELQKDPKALLRTLSSETHYQQLFRSLFQIAKLSNNAREVLLKQQWLGVKESDLPEAS